MIAFLSPNASRTGAPMVLLDFIKWYQQNSNTKALLILGRDGELLEEFKRHIDVYVRYPSYRSGQMPYYLLAVLRKFDRLRWFLFKRKLKRKKLEVVYANTVLNYSTIKEFRQLSRHKLILHVHEFQLHIEGFNKNGEVHKSVKWADKIICVSEAVRQNLLANYGADRDKTTTIHPCMPIISISDSNNRISRNDFNISEDALCVGCCGTPSLMKGVDLFLQIASEVLKERKNVYFFWIGINESNNFHYIMKTEAERLGIESFIKFIPFTSSPSFYFNMLDVFLMISRSDSFPLVNLEAGYLGTPVLCFDKAGGSKELVENACGFTVPYLDINQMAGYIKMFDSDRSLLSKMGENMRQKISEHYLSPARYDSLKEEIEVLYR